MQKSSIKPALQITCMIICSFIIGLQPNSENIVDAQSKPRYAVVSCDDDVYFNGVHGGDINRGISPLLKPFQLTKVMDTINRKGYTLHNILMVADGEGKIYYSVIVQMN
jgi:hypothetical protein